MTDFIFALNMLGENERKPGEPKFNAEKYPMVVLNMAGKLTVQVSDPEIAKEFYSGKNSKLIDKHPFTGEIFGVLLPDVFLFMPTN